MSTGEAFMDMDLDMGGDAKCHIQGKPTYQTQINRVDITRNFDFNHMTDEVLTIS